MLSTRIWVGALLIAMAVAMLVFDQRLAEWHYPILFVFQMTCALAGCCELIGLLGAERAPQHWPSYLGVAMLCAANWAVHCLGESSQAWTGILGCFTVVLLGTFFWEMATFHGPGRSIERLGTTWMVVAYLGLLPCYFAQLRWLYPKGAEQGTLAVALAIFVPKGCDIGAYFTGRLLGRHKMTPVLSPKKTWEGAAGGLVLAGLTAVGIDRLGSEPVLGARLPYELGFGLLVGAAGMLGDLAESLLKRDCQKKDASDVVPGFGGVLDVVDAVIFAAPLVYGCLWFARQ
ncbi:MAG: phosphatidate cytidylyltransferase [Gemmataceae bacterium]|nr:phosphatidate cytidylyltransferase [Gemmataceae bacterium]